MENFIDIFEKKCKISNITLKSKANSNGENFEKNTDISTEYSIIKTINKFDIIKFNGKKDSLIILHKHKLFKYFKNKIKLPENKAHGCKIPDECYLDEKYKMLFIIEKKFQETNGSACEKLQTYDFKINYYSKIFKDYKVLYIYCLSDWFKENCKEEINYILEKNGKIFYGNDKKYKKDIVNYIYYCDENGIY